MTLYKLITRLMEALMPSTYDEEVKIRIAYRNENDSVDYVQDVPMSYMLLSHGKLRIGIEARDIANTTRKVPL